MRCVQSHAENICNGKTIYPEICNMFAKWKLTSAASSYYPPQFYFLFRIFFSCLIFIKVPSHENKHNAQIFASTKLNVQIYFAPWSFRAFSPVYLHSPFLRAQYVGEFMS